MAAGMVPDMEDDGRELEGRRGQVKSRQVHARARKGRLQMAWESQCGWDAAFSGTRTRRNTTVEIETGFTFQRFPPADESCFFELRGDVALILCT